MTPPTPTEIPEYLKAPPLPAPGVDGTLAARGPRYGVFGDNAQVAQELKRVMHAARNWQDMPHDMRESLDLMASKIGRILSGDPNYADSWHDIGGYARLIEKRLEPKGDIVK